MELITDVAVINTEESLHSLTEDVRVFLLDNHNISVPLDCTGFIVRCLRIKDYNVEKAAILVKNFSQSIHQIHDMLEKFQPKFYKDLYAPDGLFTILKHRDHCGRQVITSRIAKWDPKAYDFEQVASASMLIFSYTVGESAETQRNGCVFINDLSGFGMKHVQAIKPARFTQLVKLMNDGSPGRIKGVHFIFHPTVFGIIYGLAKRFLKEKLVKRIHFHGDDLSSLHTHFSVQHLPNWLGGALDESAAVDQALTEKLLEANNIHKQLQTYRMPSH